MAIDAPGIRLTRPSAVTTPLDDRPRLRPAAIQTPFLTPRIDPRAAALPGAGLARAGEALGEVGAMLERRRQKDDELFLAKADAEDGLTWDTRFRQMTEKAPEGAAGFTKQVLDGFDEWSKDRLNAAPSEQARQRYEILHARQRGRLADSAMKFEAGARLAKQAADVDQTVTLNANRLARDPKLFDSVLADTEDAIRALDLPAAEERKRLTEARGQLAESMTHGLIDRDPSAALRVIDSGALDGFLDPRRRPGLRDHADVVLRRRQAEGRAAEADRRAELRAQVKPALDNEMAAYGAGRLVDSSVTDRQIMAAYPDTGAQLVAERAKWRGFAADVSEVALRKPEEQDALLARYAPTDGNFKADAHRYEALARAVEQDRRARQDPAGYALAHSGAVRAAFGEAAKDPAKLPNAVRLSLEVQDQAGIPEYQRRALPDGAAKSVVGSLLAAPAEKRADLIESMAAGYGDVWPAVFGDLVRAKLPDQYRALATTTDPVARKQLAEALATEKDALRVGAGKQAKAIDDEVASSLDPFRRSLALAPDGPAQAALYEEATRRLAYRNAPLAGTDAAKAAAAALINDRYDFVEQGGGIVARAPKGQGQRAGELAARLLSALTPADLPDIGGAPDLTPERRREILWQSARRGAWVTNEADDGWMLLDSRRQPVVRADGRRVEFKFTALGVSR